MDEEVASNEAQEKKPEVPPTQRQLFSLFLPLALSGIFFPLAPPVINAALARTAAPIVALAAYGLVRSLSHPMISPLFSLRQITTALARDRDMLRHIRNCSGLMSGASSVLILVCCLPLVYRPLVEEIMGIPAEIARVGLPVLIVMAATPLLVVGRGYFQGILVHYGKAGPIGTGALAYLVGAAIIMWAGVLWTDVEGALLAALALCGGQVAYLLLVWQPSRFLLRERIPERSDEVEEGQRSVRYIFFFNLPLGISAVLISAVEPAIQAGMARAPLAMESLAAYPVCLSLSWLAGTPLWNVQQVVIARVKGQASFRAVRRFVLMLSLLLAVGMGLLCLPPSAEFVFGRLIGVSGAIKELSIEGFRWLVLAPLLMGLRSLYYGTLISQDATGPVRSAAIARIGVLLAVLIVGVWHGGVNGLLVAVWATLASSAAEVLALHRAAQRVVWKREDRGAELRSGR
jgi:hypothetical protein